MAITKLETKKEKEKEKEKLKEKDNSSSVANIPDSQNSRKRISFERNNDKNISSINIKEDDSIL